MATKDYSSKQESMVAKYLGWKTVVGSGARDFHYGDLIDLEWLGECKTHMKKQDRIVFYKKHWEKLPEEAMFHHKNPVLIVDDGTQRINKTYCLFINRFDTVGDAEEFGVIVPVEYSDSDVNIRLDADKLDDTILYSVRKFDPNFKLYICSISKFKDMLENG